MCVACTWRSSLITGAWMLATAEERAACALLPTGAAGSWLFMITITCWLTFWDNCAASAAVIGCSTLLLAAGATGATGAADAATDCESTSARPDAAAVRR